MHDNYKCDYVLLRVIVWMVHSHSATGVLFQRLGAEYKKDISIDSMHNDLIWYNELNASK